MLKDSSGQKKVLLGALAVGTGAVVYFGYTRWKSRSEAKPKADDVKPKADDQGPASAQEKVTEEAGGATESKTEPSKDTTASEETSDMVSLAPLQGPTSLSRPNSTDTDHGSDLLSLSGSFEKVSLAALQERQNSNHENMASGQKSPSESFEKITLPPVSLDQSSGVTPQSGSQINSKDIKSFGSLESASAPKESPPGLSVSDMKSRFESAATAASSAPRSRTEIKVELPGAIKPQSAQNVSVSPSTVTTQTSDGSSSSPSPKSANVLDTGLSITTTSVARMAEDPKDASGKDDDEEEEEEEEEEDSDDEDGDDEGEETDSDESGNSQVELKQENENISRFSQRNGLLTSQGDDPDSVSTLDVQDYEFADVTLTQINRPQNEQNESSITLGSSIDVQQQISTGHLNYLGIGPRDIEETLNMTPGNMSVSDKVDEPAVQLSKSTDMEKKIDLLDKGSHEKDPDMSGRDANDLPGSKSGHSDLSQVLEGELMTIPKSNNMRHGTAHPMSPNGTCPLLKIQRDLTKISQRDEHDKQINNLPESWLMPTNDEIQPYAFKPDNFMPNNTNSLETSQPELVVSLKRTNVNEDQSEGKTQQLEESTDSEISEAMHSSMSDSKDIPDMLEQPELFNSHSDFSKSEKSTLPEVSDKTKEEATQPKLFKSDNTIETDPDITETQIPELNLSLVTQSNMAEEKDFDLSQRVKLDQSDAPDGIRLNVSQSPEPSQNNTTKVDIAQSRNTPKKVFTSSINRSPPKSIPEVQDQKSLAGSAPLFSIGGDDFLMDPSLSPGAYNQDIFRPGSPIASYSTPMDIPQSPRSRRSPFVIRSPKVLWNQRPKSPTPTPVMFGSPESQIDHPASPIFSRSPSSFSRKSSTASITSLYESSSDLKDLENVTSVMMRLYKHLPKHDEETESRRLQLALRHPEGPGKLVDLGASLVEESANNRHVVDVVELGSLAQDIGLRTGDELIAINNMDITKWKPDVVILFLSKVPWNDLELIKRPGICLDSKKNMVQHVAVNLTCDKKNVKVKPVIVERPQHPLMSPIELGEFNPKGCVIQLADRGRCLALNNSTLCALDEHNKQCEMMRLLYSRPGTGYKTPVTMLAFFGGETIHYIYAVDRHTVQIMKQTDLRHSIKSLKHADCRFFYHRFIGGHHCFETTFIPDHYLAIDDDKVSLKHLESAKQVYLDKSVLFDVHYKPVNTTGT